MNYAKRNTFPELRALMARHGMNYRDMAEVLGVSTQTFHHKINGKHSFNYKDMERIKLHFSAKGEQSTVDDIFFCLLV